MQDGAQEFGRLHAVLAIVTEAGDRTGLVVVVPIQAVPANLGQSRLPATQDRLQLEQTERDDVPLAAVAVAELDMLEMDDHVQLGPPRVGAYPALLDGDPQCLSNSEELTRSICEHLTVHFLQELVPAWAADKMRLAIPPQATREDVTVWQRRVLRDHVNGVHAEPIDAPIEPPAHHCVDSLPDLGVLPVEVGLLAGEQVQVVLA